MDEAFPNEQNDPGFGELSSPPPPAEAAPASAGESSALPAVRPFDFRKSAILPAREFRRLWQRQEKFGRSLADRLSLTLRRECSLKLSDLDTLSYGEFVQGLTAPSQLSLFRLEPLHGVCLLNLPPRFGLALVDRLLGGPGVAPAATRELSEIELTLLEQVVRAVLEEWCRSWLDVRELTPVLLGHETNGKYVQSSAPDTSMLVLALDAKLGECAVLVQLAFPFHTLAPLLRQLAPMPVAGGPEQTSAETAAPSLPAGWAAIPIPLSAGWHDLELTARELGSLKVGDVIQLAPELAGRVRVRLADKSKFVGRLGTQGKHWAVELVQPIEC